MDFKNPKDLEHYKIVSEQSFNNTAAINVLVDIVARSGLISMDDFNARVRKEAETLRQEMIEKVTKAEK